MHQGVFLSGILLSSNELLLVTSLISFQCNHGDLASCCNILRNFVSLTSFLHGKIIIQNWLQGFFSFFKHSLAYMLMMPTVGYSAHY